MALTDAERNAMEAARQKQLDALPINGPNPNEDLNARLRVIENAVGSGGTRINWPFVSGGGEKSSRDQEIKFDGSENGFPATWFLRGRRG